MLLYRKIIDKLVEKLPKREDITMRFSHQSRKIKNLSELIGLPVDRTASPTIG